jgi:hypothetical protein
VTLEEARQYLEPALSYAGGTHLWEDIVQGVAEQRYQFWPGNRSAIVTEIIEYPRRRVLHYFLAGGTIPALQAMLPNIDDFGRRHGCTSATLCGRLGWTRSFLMQEGWKPTVVTMMKEL